MSLAIDSRRISGVYALDQWFKVKINSFSLDDYELMDYYERQQFGEEYTSYDGEFRRNTRYDWYCLGKAYPQIEQTVSPGDGYSREAHMSGFAGAQWTDAETGETVSMSLMEIKAWRQVSEAKATEACPRLSRQKAEIDEAAYREKQADLVG